MHPYPDPEQDQFFPATQSENTDIVFLRKLLCPEKCLQIKHEGFQSIQAWVISISSSLTTLILTPSMLNPSRQDQDWTSQQRTRNSTACLPTEGCDLIFNDIGQCYLSIFRPYWMWCLWYTSSGRVLCLLVWRI